jgi:endonuclease YncB( thermonuclease family)
VIALIAIVAMLVVADRLGLFLTTRHDDFAIYHGMEAQITAVISAHVIEIDQPDLFNDRSRTRVRLWGLNAPQPARPGRKAQPLADEAFAFVESIALEQAAVLLLEPHRPRDTFGNILAHVVLADGTRLNEAILEAGLAQTDDRWPHQHLKRYARAERMAQRSGGGIWSPNLQN